jgi:hypothetical protein
LDFVMDRSRLKPGWLQLSLRELLLVSAFCGVACAALKYAGGTWELMLSAAVLLLFMAAAVAAVVDRGRRQAAATGVVLCLVIYGTLVWSAPPSPSIGISRELDPGSGRLPTSLALGRVYETLVVRTTGMPGGFGGRSVVPVTYGGASGMPGGGQTFYIQVESPDRHAFMAVGHWLWALLLGYAGCRLALWCYDRRERGKAEQQSPALP